MSLSGLILGKNGNTHVIKLMILLKIISAKKGFFQKKSLRHIHATYLPNKIEYQFPISTNPY